MPEEDGYKGQTGQDAHFLARHAPKEMSLEEKRCFLLEGLFDTGPKTAQALIKIFFSPQNLFEAIKKSELIFTKKL